MRTLLRLSILAALTTLTLVLAQPALASDPAGPQIELATQPAEGSAR